MAYKKLIKVSNVCQLLDKSKYSETNTVNGVTFTNNGDGSFTINGTASVNTYFNIQNIGINRVKSGITIYLNANILRAIRNNVLFEYSSYSQTNGWVYFFIPKGGVCENLVAKPQLFDLTEMYGAGHEPTTVGQFRQDFPDEIYDYSPHCWLTSYKRVILTGGGNYLTSYQRNLTCKTKNLFDINSAAKVSGGSSFSKNGNQITVSGNSGYRYISANVLLDTSLVGKTVTFSAYAKTSDKNTACLRIQWKAPTGLASSAYIQSASVSGQAYQRVRLTGVIPTQPDDTFNMLCLSFYSNGYNAISPLPS